MKLLLENIRELVQVEDQPVALRSGKEMANVKTIKNAFLIISDELIYKYGPMESLKDTYRDDDLLVEIDCSNRLVYPCYCDSHTHLVFPGSREKEFVHRIKGLSYEEIAQRGGGILNSAKMLQEKTEEELYNDAMTRIFEIT